jgi:hypothetical protein
MVDGARYPNVTQFDFMAVVAFHVRALFQFMFEQTTMENCLIFNTLMLLDGRSFLAKMLWQIWCKFFLQQVLSICLEH